MTNTVLSGKPNAGNPRVRFDEGEVASGNPRRGSLLYKKLITTGLIISAVLMVPSFAFAGDMNEWKGSTGDWSSPEMWKKGHAPTNTEDVVIYAKTAGTTNTVRLTCDVSNAFSRVRLRPNIGKGVVLDGNGQTLLAPDLESTESVYETVPLTFGNPYNYSEAHYVYTGDQTGSAYLGAYKLVNPRIEMTEDEDGTVHTLFTRGTFDFWCPNGTELEKARFRIGESAGNVTKWHTRFAGSGTKVTFPCLELRNYAKENVLEFADGEYLIQKDFLSNGQTYDMSSGAGSVHTVRVTDGATLTIAGTTCLYLHADRTEASGDAKYSWNFEVLNGSTLNTTNVFYTYRSTNGVLRLENSTWNAPGPGKDLAVGIGYAADDWFHATTQKMVAVNSTINVGQGHNNGNFCIGRCRDAKRSFGSLFATNCIFDVKSWFKVSPGTVVLKDCTWTGNGYDNYSMSFENEANATLDGGTYSKIVPRLSFDTTASVGPTLNIKGATIEYLAQTWNIGYSDMASICSKTCTVHMTSGSVASRWVSLSPKAQPGHFILEGGNYSVKQTYGGAGSHAKQPTKGGWAYFTANGGTVLCPDQETYTYARPLFNDLDLFEVGSKGVIFDTNGKKNHYMVQDVTNMSGEKGRFVKRGAEQLRLVIPSKWDVAETVVEDGSLLIDTNGVSTAVTMATAMSVGSGTTLSTVGNTESLTLDALAVTNATLALDAGDVITVKGAFAPSALKLDFSSALTEDVSVNCFVFEEPLSSDAVAALKLAIVTSALPGGTVSTVNLSTDAQTGRTTVTVTATKKPTVTGETVWNGVDSTWDKSSNWSAGVPTVAQVAKLTNGSVEKTVVVTNDQEIGALTISDDRYSVEGAGRLDFAAYDNSRVDVASGSHEISAGLLTRETISVNVSSGACLAVTGPGYGRGFSKEGKGRMTLDGAGLFSSGTVKAHGGRLVVSNEAAFAGATVTLGNGTLEIPEASAIVDGGRLAIVATNVANEKMGSGTAAGAVVVDNAGDATFTGLDITSGCLVKRGKGTLTLDLSDGKSSTLAVANGDYLQGGSVFGNRSYWAFDEDGTPPNFGYAGLSVMGGELVIRGDGATDVKSSGAFVVGSHTTTDCGAQPILTFDNLKLSFNAGYFGIIVGNRAGCQGVFAKTPVLRIVNGSTVTTGYDIMLSCDYASDNTPEAHPTIAVTNSTVIAKNMGYGDPSLYFSTLRSRGLAVASLMTDNSRLEAKQFIVGGTTESRITGSTLTGVDGTYTKFTSDQYRKGRILFDGGTVIKVNTINWTPNNSYTRMMTWAFDDATWDFGEGDFAITSANCYLSLNRFEMVGTGLRIAPAAGKTFSTDAVFMGEGGLVKSGAGTLKFNAGTYQFTGPLCALAGTVDLSAVGTVTNACFGAGDGVISEGTLKDPVFRMDAGAPNLANCTILGRGYLDVGDEPLVSPYPENLTVLRFTGSAPDVSNWRLRGAGRKGLCGAFSVVGNEVKVTIKVNGMMLIVR